MMKYLILLLLICSISAFAENKQTICASCTQMMKDNEDYVCRTGYGRGSTLEQADSLAHKDAYVALLQALRDSVKSTCKEIKIENENGNYLFAIKYLDRKENPELYYFIHENVMVNTFLQCHNRKKKKNGTYHVCCVLAVSKTDFNQVYNHILNEKMLKMLFYYF